MSDAQVLMIAVALSTSFLAVFMGVLLNNNRLNEVRALSEAKISRVKQSCAC